MSFPVTERDTYSQNILVPTRWKTLIVPIHLYTEQFPHIGLSTPLYKNIIEHLFCAKTWACYQDT